MSNIREKGKESAVSPVVGVLLMLVVTIIIAAVVSGFAGGLVENKQKTPQVNMDVSFIKTSNGANMLLKHLGGDSINTKNVQLITSWANSTGVTNYQKTVAPTYSDTLVTYRTGSGQTTCHYTLDSLNTDYSGNYNEPYLVIAGDMPADGVNKETELWWGNYVMKAGDVAKVDGSMSSWATSLPAPVVKNYQYITTNDQLNVKIIDSTSGGTIFEKNINVVEG